MRINDRGGGGNMSGGMMIGFEAYTRRTQARRLLLNK